MGLVVWTSVASALLVSMLGCAPNYYDTYKAKEPYYFGSGPSQTASLHEVLAILYAPPVADYSLIVAKLAVLRLEEGGPVELSREEIDATLASGASGDYGVIATLSCQSEYNIKRYAGEKVAWYLLRQGKLTAYDHFDFVDFCAVANEFRAARADTMALEAQVLSYRDENFPKSMEHAGQFYRRGLGYLNAERPDDALRMLQAGDAAVDVGRRGEQHVDKEASTQIRVSKGRDVEKNRAALVKRLRAAGVDVPER
ncbi:MAG: hypothetical protein ACR2PQ_12610 [Myxococcota bacterium]